MGMDDNLPLGEAGQTENVPDYYANSVKFAVAPFDFMLEFGVGRAPSKPGVAAVDPVARIRISPQLAYALSKILAANVALYESQVGKIALPDQYYMQALDELGQSFAYGEEDKE